MEQRKFLKLHLWINNKKILVPVDSITEIEEAEKIEDATKVSFQHGRNGIIKSVLVKENIKEITELALVNILL